MPELPRPFGPSKVPDRPASVPSGRPSWRSRLSRLHLRLLALILVSVAPAFAIIVHSSLEQRDAAVRRAHEQALATARLVAAHHRGLIAHSHQLLASLSRLPEIRGQAPGPACDQLLAGLLPMHEHFVSMIVAGRDGLVRCSAVPPNGPLNVGDRAYFRRAVESRAFASGDYQLSQLTGRSVFPLAHPVFGAGDAVQAVVAVGMDLAAFADLGHELALPLGSIVTLVDRQGTIMARLPRAPDRIGRQVAEPERFRTLTTYRREGSFASYTLDGTPSVVGVAPVSLGSEGGALVYVHVAIPSRVVLAEADRAFMRNLGLLALAAASLLWMGWLTSRRLVLQPVQVLSDTVQRLGAGDLRARTGLREGGELGQLARSFDAMADELQRRQDSLTQAKVELRRSNRALRVFNRVHAILDHARDETALLQDICQAVVDTGGYLRAFVAYALHDEEKTVRPMAWASADPRLFDLPRLRWDDSEAGCGPSGTAIRTGQTALSRNVAEDLGRGPWREAALQGGLGAILSIPLRADGAVFGVLSIAAAEADAFDPEELTLLEETATHLAFGIEALRARTERVRAEHALAESEEKLRGILSSIDTLVWSMAASSGELLYINQAAQRILGRAPEDFYRQPQLWLDMLHPQDRAQATASMDAQGADAVQREYRVLRPDGEVRWLDARLRLVRDPAGRALRIDGVAADITARKRDEARIEHLATRNALTGLPNRRLLVDRLEQALSHAGRTQRILAVVVVNLDRLKLINDSLGHAMGDRLLVAVGQRLQESVRGGDTVAHLGGDEFAILLADLKAPEGALTAMAKLHQAFVRPFRIEGHELRITASLGAAVHPTDGQQTEALLQHAHAAMHRAKAEGGNGLQFYAQQMSAEAREKVQLEQALRMALQAGGQLELHYQPQVDLADGRLLGVEALARWRHPELGPVSPARFIPLAEETGLIVPLTEWALRAACTQMLAWRHAGLALARVAVNLSARQFWQGDVVGMVSRVLAETGLPARHLELEITESVVMRNIENTVDALEELRALGVTVSLDDFGTGYSSLSYLRRLPVDKVKIDQSFVRDMPSHADAALLVKEIVLISHVMQRQVIAEGVESPAVAELLREIGCDGAQGYHFSPPLAAEPLAQWVAARAEAAPS